MVRRARVTNSELVRVNVSPAALWDSLVVVTFEVEDTGIGIPAADIPRLFEKFTQVESPGVSRPGGTGLGLAISKQLVQLIGGTIGISSEPGRGNLWRRLVLPLRVGNWSLTSLQQRLVKTGGRLIKHARYYWLLLAEGHLTRRLSGAMLRRIEALSLPAG